MPKISFFSEADYTPLPAAPHTGEVFPIFIAFVVSKLLRRCSSHLSFEGFFAVETA